MSDQGVESHGEQKFFLPTWLTKYPGQKKPQTADALEKMRSWACCFMSAHNCDRLEIDGDKTYSLHHGGDYATIRENIRKHHGLTVDQMLAVHELCALMTKQLDQELLSCARALMSVVANLLKKE